MTTLADDLDDLASRLRPLTNSGGRADQHSRDLLFVKVMDHLKPRIAHLIRRYGLADMREDAQQACAIGIHRALESFDPAKSRFTTHVTWQLRGELQSLRHRMRLDQRQSARSAQMRTVSLDALTGTDSEVQETLQIVDHDALWRTERKASDRMTIRCVRRLLDRSGTPPKEHPIVLDHVFDRNGEEMRHERSSEQRRQVARRALRNCAKILAAERVAA